MSTNHSKLLLFLALFLMSIDFGAAREHIISWNSSNTQFQRRGDDPTIDVRLGDMMRFVCPDNADGDSPDNEYLAVFEVGELAFGDCMIESHSREILRCGSESMGEKFARSQNLNANALKPSKGRQYAPKNVAIPARQINPIPGGKEFQPGQTYYYITTSTGKADGMNVKSRGLCESSNMRMAVRILPAMPAPSHPIITASISSRQQDEVVSSEKMRRDRVDSISNEEDEDSEDGEAATKVLTRDVDTKKDEWDIARVSPKFRRPHEFSEAAQSAGVRDQQFQKVIQMAKEGRTGTFENTFDPNFGTSGGDWEPVNVHYMSDRVHTNHGSSVDLSYQREPEPDFVIHEENSVRSLEYSSSATFSTPLFTFLLVVAVFWM